MSEDKEPTPSRAWTVTMIAWVQVNCAVEADTREEAVEKAEALADTIGQAVHEQGTLLFPPGAQVTWRGRSAPECWYADCSAPSDAVGEPQVVACTGVDRAAFVAASSGEQEP
jgi:hypothetical protein